MYQKLKSGVATFLRTDQYFYSGLIVVVAVSAFVLGRFSVDAVPLFKADGAAQAAAVGVTLLSTPLPPVAAPTEALGVGEEGASTTDKVTPSTGNYVASKSGQRYHHLSCPGAKLIKPENRLYFATMAEAEAAGYTKAANCHQW